MKAKQRPGPFVRTLHRKELDGIYRKNALRAFLLTATLAVSFWYTFQLGWLLAYTWAVNACALGLMAEDKSAAQRGTLRIPEKVFYVLVVMGGAPGTLIAMKLFRHKTRKASFQFYVVLISTLQAYLAMRLGFFGSQ